MLLFYYEEMKKKNIYIGFNNTVKQMNNDKDKEHLNVTNG